jgi:hypothetical protein
MAGTWRNSRKASKRRCSIDPADQGSCVVPAEYADYDRPDHKMRLLCVLPQSGDRSIELERFALATAQRRTRPAGHAAPRSHALWVARELGHLLALGGVSQEFISWMHRRSPAGERSLKELGNPSGTRVVSCSGLSEPPVRPERSRPQSGSFCLSGHDRYGRFLRDVQGSVQIGIVKDRPQASNYLLIRLGLIRQYTPDCPKHECKKCVAAPQRPHDGGRTDDFA